MADAPRVLVVEDEGPMRDLVTAELLDRGIAAAGAADLAAARALLGEREFDVVLLDMRLPDTDGLELLRRIRDIHPDVPVIITTAYVSVEPQLRVLDLAHSAYLIKPFDLDDLGAAIDRAG